ncbi:MAG: hypothetical protein ACXVBW_08095 [Bdellovibrionota bacterium]
MINSLKYAKMLEDVGFSRDQAETSIKILVETMEDKLASKQDLKDLEVALKQDFKTLEIGLRQESKDLESRVQRSISELRSEVSHSLAQMESKLTIRLGTMLAASIAILTALQKLA